MNGRLVKMEGFSGAQRSIENAFVRVWICFQKLGKSEKC